MPDNDAPRTPLEERLRDEAGVWWGNEWAESAAMLMDEAADEIARLTALLTPTPSGQSVRAIDITRVIVEEAGASLGPANKATRRICDMLAGAAPAQSEGEG